MSSNLRMALDLGPLAVFFIAYRAGGMAWGTAALVAATLTSLAVTYALERRIAAMPLVSGILAGGLGGLTLLLHDDYWIKLKPTVLNLFFAIVLLGGLAAGKPLLKYLLGEALQLTEAGWRKLSFRWAFFFVFLALLNEWIWRHYSTDFWVNFKVFGMMTLTMIFSVCQVPLIQKYWMEPPKDEPETA